LKRENQKKKNRKPEKYNRKIEPMAELCKKKGQKNTEGTGGLS
jgi:hypothetical protein